LSVFRKELYPSSSADLPSVPTLILEMYGSMLLAGSADTSPIGCERRQATMTTTTTMITTTMPTVRPTASPTHRLSHDDEPAKPPKQIDLQSG